MIEENAGNSGRKVRVQIPENRLVPVGLDLKQRSKTHLKARIEKGIGYPDRFPVPEGITWGNVDRSTYRPVDYTAGVVMANDRTKDPSDPKLWADPEDPRQAKGAPDFPSYEGKIQVDLSGRPLNPMGPTGIEGRGLLGNWGANNAADPIVTRVNDVGQIEMIVIRRKDTGEWAIPGGMVDRGEKITETLKRELGEETSAELDFDQATPVYKGYVDDPRNTDNAWMETDAYHLHLPNGIQMDLKEGDDADAAKWMVLTEDSLNNLYASHSIHVARAIAIWQERTGVVVNRRGRVSKP